MEREGYREIVVTGIEIASWGWDLKEDSTITDLVEAICLSVPQVRIRLGSLEPRVVDEAFCQRLSACKNLCPQFHLSLQSGSNGVLKRMRRRYDAARYLQSVELLNRYFPQCAVTTDLIVGFPGETEQELEESLAFCKACGFAAIHIFPYSRRVGTPADTMPLQVEKGVKTQMAARASRVAQELQEQFNQNLVGTVQEVLFEQEEGPFFTGHARNGVKVYTKAVDLHNISCSVRIDGLHADGVEGRLL